MIPIAFIAPFVVRNKSAGIMKWRIHLLAAALLMAQAIQAQPWKNPLMITRSTDGVNFSTPAIFQVSAGVPSLVRWHADTLIAAFQWFRQPNPSPGLDRVA